MFLRRRKRNSGLYSLEPLTNARNSRKTSTGTEIPCLGCTVCHCQLNGVEPISQHLSSAGHIRRAEIKKAVLGNHSSQPLNCVDGLNSASEHNLFQHETIPTQLSTEKKATFDLNPLGLGDGIQILPVQMAAVSSFARPREVLGFTQDVNILQKETNLPAAAMNTLPWKPRKGPNGEPYVMTGDRGFCYVCNLELTSVQHCRQHVQGSKHIKKDREITSLLNPQTDNSLLPNSARATILPEQNVKVIHNGGSSVDVYDFLGPGGHCFVCNVVFTSERLANEHIAGQKHKKKVAMLNLLEFAVHKSSGVVSSGQSDGIIANPGLLAAAPSYVMNSSQAVGNGFSVPDHIPSVVSGSEQSSQVDLRQTDNIPLDVNSADCTSDGQAGAGTKIEGYSLSDVKNAGHTTGATSNMDTLGQIKAPILPKDLNLGLGYSYITSNNVGSGVISGSIQPNLANSGSSQLHIATSGSSQPHTATSGQITGYAAASEIGLAPSPAPSRGPKGEPYVMNGSRGYCYVCKLSLTSEAHANSHITGKKHKKKYWEELVNGNTGNTLAAGTFPSENSHVLMCKICNVPFSSPENARQHFVSDKHRKKLSFTSSFPAFENAQDTNLELAGVTSVYLSSVSAPGELQSHDFVGDAAVSLENNEEQISQLLAPNRELLKGFNTKTCIVNGSSVICSVCNIVLTSLQHYREHIQDSEHIKKEKEFFSAKLQESFDPEQTLVMKIYESAVPVTSAQGNSHGTSADPVFENAELQVRNPQLLPPSKDPQAGAFTKPYVMWGDRGVCYVCNVELTSPQLCTQHILGRKHVKKVMDWSSRRLFETVNPKQPESEKVVQPQVDNETAHSNPELSLLSQVKKELGTFDNSILNSTGTFPHYSTRSLPTITYSNVTEEEYSNTESQLSTHNDVLEINQAQAESFKCETRQSPLSFPNTVLSESNTAAAARRKTDANVMIKVETHVQGSSTNSKDMLQSSNLSSQQEEPLKVTYKEIEVHSDYEEHENAGVSLTENNLQPSDVSVTKKTVENSSSNIKVENYVQVTGMSASENRKHQTDLMSLRDKIQRSSHQNSDTGARSSHQDSDTGARSSHQDSETGARSSHQDSETGAKSSHQDSETGARSSHQDSDDTGARSSHQDSDDTGARSSHQNSDTGARSSHQDSDDTGARSSHQNSDTGASSFNQNFDTGARSSHQNFDTGASSPSQSTPDTGSLIRVMQDFQELSLLSDRWDPSIQPDEIPQNSQHSDPHSGSSDLQQTPSKTSQLHPDSYASSSDLQQTSKTTSKQHVNSRASSSDLQQTPNDLRSSPSDQQQTPDKLMLNVTSSLSSQHPGPHSSPSDLQQTPFDPHPSSSDLQQTSNRTFQHFNPHPSSSDLQQTSNRTSQHFNPHPSSSDLQQTSNRTFQHFNSHPSSSDLQQTSNRTSQQHFNPHLSSSDLQQASNNSNSSSSDQQQTLNKMLNVASSLSHQSPPLDGSLANPTSNKSAPYYFDGSSGYCYCCSIELTSLQHANQHLYGQKHKKRSEQWELTSALQNGPSLQTPSPPQQFSPPNGNLANPTSNKSAPYYFDGSKGYCNCCSVELTSLQHANQHLYGQRHKKRLEQWEVTSALQNRPSQQTQAPPEQQVQQPAEDSSYYFNGDRGFCHVCNIELTSFQHAQQHISGKPHKRTKERFNRTQNGIAYPLNCQICSKIFTGQESAQQHFTSANHKMKVEVLNESVKVLSVVDEGRVVMKDGQVWHVCDLCKVAMNSREQYLFHRESSKHKRECENSKNRISFSENGPVEFINDAAVQDPSNYTYRTSSCASSSRASSVETVQEELDTAALRYSQAKFEDQQIQDGANRQKVLDENRHYLIYGQAPVISRDISKTADSGQPQTKWDNLVGVAGLDQPLVSQDVPIVSGSSQPLISRDNPIVSGLSQPLISRDNPMVSGSCQLLIRRDIPTMSSSGQLPVNRYSPMVSGSSPQLPTQDISKTTGSVTAEQPHALINNSMASASKGYLERGAVSSSSSALNQTSGSQSNADGRSQGQHRQTGLHSFSSDHSREQAQLTSAQASSASSQIYDFWQSLRADGGQNAGLDFISSPQMRAGAILANSSGGRSQSCNGAGTHISDPHSNGSGTPISEPHSSGSGTPISEPHSSGSGTHFSDPQSNVSINQGATGFSLEDNTEDDLGSGQNHLNSASGDDSFPNPDILGNVIMKPKLSKSQNRRNERLRNDVLYLDKQEFDDEFDNDYEEENKDDLNIIEEVPPEVPTPPAVPMRSGKPGFRYYCPICNKHMNTREAYETHAQGKYHVYMLSSSPAPVRKLEPICKINRNEGDILSRVCGIISKQLNIYPRVYQIELVLKAMKGDCIIYLPTGTGKTLVAVLTMGLMLQDNPSRPVLFLVDKVLLVMQQAQYIIRHFAGTLFKRQDGALGSPLVTRELQVKPICGGMTTKTDVPVWKHDIVVTTAAYCANMLDRKQIRWEDFSLVVLDEVHHCGKGHPYHKLMSTYHCSLPEHARAKVLGLTASPAGKSTVEQTYIMLKSLLANLGGASVAVVEENNACLDLYQSMAKVKPVCVPMSSKEKDFKGRLLEYIVLCYSQLALMTHNLQSNEPPCSFFLDALRKPGDREVAAQLAEQFMKDPEPLSEVLDVIFKARCIDEVDVTGRNRFDNLRLHICQLLLIIPEVGSGADIDELLGHLSPSGITEEFKKMGLPCDQIYERAVRFAKDGNNDLTMFSKLVETLQDPDLISWADTSSRALVLVRERKRARQYCLKLRAHPMVEKKNLRVGHIVGHGKGAKDGGMDVKKQRKVFDNHEKYHILVATSIMEEGIDIQALQLVVCMNPPNSLRALVQMRGRARREGSHFVVLCSTQEDVDKLNSLQKQEQNMREAAKRCLEELK